jgi:NAD(P)-dependent dehydrogenase (short-subunit alcohol dehydrogenase family)
MVSALQDRVARFWKDRPESSAKRSGAMSKQLSDKRALVTGAASGIGRAVAIAFAREGADIVGLDAAGRVSPTQTYPLPTSEDLAETGRMVAANGGKWTGEQADIRDRAALKAMAQRYGAFDVLALVAGIQAFRPIAEMEDADWDDQIEINLTGTANCLRAFAPAMLKRGSGRIILTSSTQGRHGTLNGSAYSASKWGLLGLMKSAALEFAPQGVTVNAVIPGLIDTRLTRHRDRYLQALQLAGAGKVPPGDLEANAKAALTRGSPMRLPWLPPEDVAKAYVYLAGDSGNLVCGAAIEVTAGDSAHFE